jgi:hypothetical protein
VVVIKKNQLSVIHSGVLITQCRSVKARRLVRVELFSKWTVHPERMFCAHSYKIEKNLDGFVLSDVKSNRKTRLFLKNTIFPLKIYVHYLKFISFLLVEEQKRVAAYPFLPCTICNK